jgi:glycosyltransferase involved in cell wall biosynthesis
VKLFIQIPCLNEEATLPEVIEEIPRRIPGIDEVRVLVIDDGSTDRTAEVARAAGADYVVRLPRTQGLARAFVAGVNACLELGADVIVNTDGDHQYRGRDIAPLIQPILDGRAEIVIGDRQVAQVAHFSPVKRWLQRLGSQVVSRLCHVRLPDVTSGFRAYSRHAAFQLNVFSNFSYTLETLFLAGSHRLPVVQVPIGTNRPMRPSRLFRSITSYLRRSTATIVRAYALYEPLRTFFYLGGLLVGLGAVGVARFLYFYAVGEGGGHIQSLVLSGVLIIIGVQAWMLGILADLISINRRLSEDILYRVRRTAAGLPVRRRGGHVVPGPPLTTAAERAAGRGSR